jgi:hypothetical protein
MTDIFLQFDPASVARIRKILEFDALLQVNFLEAMNTSLDWLEISAQARMWAEFQNPTGALEGAFEKTIYGWDEGELANPSPYAFRREYGFSGMTDSLGRFYAYDPGIAYMHGAIVDEYDNIQLNFQVALDKTITEMVK